MLGTSLQTDSQRRYVIFWLALAVAALAVLGGVLAIQDRSNLLRWSVFLSTDLEQGRTVFREKGCIRCHSVNGVGGNIGPDLGEAGANPSGLPFLVTAMWNHAPHMWAYMRAEGVSYPTLSYEETAQVVAYLYMASRMDAEGDAQHGRLLFTTDRCIRCHSVTGKDAKRLMQPVGADPIQTPMAWAQTMWNNAAPMEEALQKAGLPWPKLATSDLNDLFAYVRESGQDPVVSQQFPGDSERGWQLFQSRGCIDCHSPREDSPSGPESWPASTFMEVGELMWNDAPGMSQAMQEHGVASAPLTGEEMTDLAAFVFALRYFDPPGSAIVGRSDFSWRGCSRCHGQDAQGTAVAPALRGHGRNYNSISLATALWSHGHKMFQRSQSLGLGWPTLEASDVGDLLAFLNTPTKARTGKVEGYLLPFRRPILRH
ncbi:MAG TPA: c-type cytochrome [Candidatus Acidoferrales bacterium]|nr:c-type cytochrome [Candidatus Acidoferrales bacterium]